MWWGKSTEVLLMLLSKKCKWQPVLCLPILYTKFPWMDLLSFVENMVCTYCFICRVEKQYYSESLVHFPPVCYWCGGQEETLLHDEEYYCLELRFQTEGNLFFFVKLKQDLLLLGSGGTHSMQPNDLKDPDFRHFVLWCVRSALYDDIFAWYMYYCMLWLLLFPGSN